MLKQTRALALAGALLVAASSGGTLPESPDWTASAGQPQALFGAAVASAGDVNGDGFDDLIVGAHSFDDGQENEGKAFVFTGSANGPSSVPAWTAQGDSDYAYFGTSVSGAGDVNGDGFDDIVVGAPYATGAFEEEGFALVYFGGPAGPSPQPDWIAAGGQAGAAFGISVAAAGDLNGDGFDDLIVGAEGFTGAFAAEGRAFVFLGSPAGPSLLPDWTFDGGRAFARLGNAVATAGDVNGDGFDDAIVGSYYADGDHPREGRAYVFHGSPQGPSPQPDWAAGGGRANALFGGAVATAGDVDGDGFDDAIVGAWGYSEANSWEGAAFLFTGSPSGLSPQATWTVVGNQPDGSFGASVAAAGDIDGDGFSDVAVGSPLLQTDGVTAGGVFLYFGSSAGLSIEPGWTARGSQEGGLFGVRVARAVGGLLVGEEGFDGEGRVLRFAVPVPPETPEPRETPSDDPAGAEPAPIAGRSSGHGCSLFAAERGAGSPAWTAIALTLLLLIRRPRAS